MKSKPVFRLHRPTTPWLTIAMAAWLINACQGSLSSADLTATALADPTGLTPRAMGPTWTPGPTLTPLPSSTPRPAATASAVTATRPASPSPFEMPDRLIDAPIALDELPAIAASNARALRLVAAFPAPQGYLYSPNWSWLAAFTPGQAHLYQLNDGSFQRRVRMNQLEPVDAGRFAFDFSEDGSLLAWTVAPGVVEVSQTAGGVALHTLEVSDLCCQHLRLSPDASMLLAFEAVGDSPTEDAIRVWDLSTAAQVLQMDNVYGSSFSVDGSLLGFFHFTPEDERQLIVWDTQTQQVIFRQSSPFAFQFLPEGKQLMYAIAVSHQVSAVFYDLETGRELRRLSGFETAAPIISVGFSPDYRSLVWEARASQLMDVSTGRLIPSPPIDYYLRFSPDGRDLIGVRIGMVYEPSLAPLVVLDRQSGKVLHEFDIPATSGDLQFSPVSRLLAVYDREAELTRILNLAVGEIVMTLDAGKPHAFSPDGRLLALTGQGQGWIWAARP